MERLETAIWRTGWDSNPRRACTLAGFQDRCLKPLGHLSAVPSPLAALGGAGKLSSAGAVNSVFPPSRDDPVGNSGKALWRLCPFASSCYGERSRKEFWCIFLSGRHIVQDGWLL